MICCLPISAHATPSEGEPLRGLLGIIEQQADEIDGDIRQLYENAFIETCEPWAVPYIGDLVGTLPLFDESRVRDGDTAAELFRDLQGPDLRPPDRAARPSRSSPRRSTTRAARARCRCSRSWRAT